MSPTETFIPWTAAYGAKGYPVGRIVARRDIVNHNASYETASWYKDVRIAAGASATLWHDGGHYGARATFDGVVVASHFPSSFGGVSYGANPSDADALGKPDTASVGVSHAAVLAGGDDDWAIVLAPEYRVTAETYERDGGGQSKRYQWHVAESGHPLEMVRESHADVRGDYLRGQHAYRMVWRGEDRGVVMVPISSGFNGDTSRVAMRKGLEALMGA